MALQPARAIAAADQADGAELRRFPTPFQLYAARVTIDAYARLEEPLAHEHRGHARGSRISESIAATGIVGSEYSASHPSLSLSPTALSF